MQLLRAAWPLFAIAAGAGPLGAQLFTRPELRWETVHTTHFDVHFPRTMRPWAIDAAGRLEAVQASVVRIVGSSPPGRVTVVIDDPYNVSNGAALPLLNAPTIVLWPTPPVPSDDFGSAANWTELLAVHEFAHIVHSTRPSRNALDRAVWHVLPVDLSPMARRSPRWVMEGYATYIEGVLTGGGRPFSAARAGVLRQWAIEGRLPTYAELDGSPRFLGSDMAYLAGSAFLEWLVARAGDASLPSLWRRMTARVDRDFARAFTGVYGDTPAALYGRFTAELTGKALHAAGMIAAAGLDSGQTFQHLTWYTGDPAVSPGGGMIAVPVRLPGRPTRIVVWSTGDAPAPAARERAAARALLARDPQDVPAVPAFPAYRPPLATLDASRGRGYDSPRFLGDGGHLLVSHDEPIADGAIRPELYDWDMHSGVVRRITHGAAVRDADPSPDGRGALAARCVDGVCDLVRVSLPEGRVGVLLKGSPMVEYDHPRYAPDGRSAIVTVHDSAGWYDELLAIADAGATVRGPVGPADGANRYGAAFVARGTGIVTVSDLGGVEHLELIDLATGKVKVLAVTTGGVRGPDAARSDSTVYFLTTSARGRDLHRVSMRAARDGRLPSLPAMLAPAAIPASPPPSAATATAAIDPPTPYGLGPREYRYLPGGAIGPSGTYITVLVGSSDPVGRLDWTLQGAIGDAGTWRGAAAAAAWRGLPVTLAASAFAVSDFPSRQHAGGFAPDSLDASLAGGVVSASLVRYGSLGASAFRLGGSIAQFSGTGTSTGARELVFAGYTASGNLSQGALALVGGLGALGTAGRTDGAAWQRLLMRGSVGVGVFGLLIRYAAVYDLVTRTTPLFERPVVGGEAPPLTDSALLSQRLAAPGLPIGALSGRQILGQRLEDDTGPIAIYYDRFTSPSDHNAPHDLFGAEIRGTLPPVPFLAVPGASATMGTAYSISTPFKYKLRGYVAIRYAP